MKSAIFYRIGLVGDDPGQHHKNGDWRLWLRGGMKSSGPSIAIKGSQRNGHLLIALAFRMVGHS